jgi:hypothetical protein
MVGGARGSRAGPAAGRLRALDASQWTRFS